MGRMLILDLKAPLQEGRCVHHAGWACHGEGCFSHIGGQERLGEGLARRPTYLLDVLLHLLKLENCWLGLSFAGSWPLLGGWWFAMPWGMLSHPDTCRPPATTKGASGLYTMQVLGRRRPPGSSRCCVCAAMVTARAGKEAGFRAARLQDGRDRSLRPSRAISLTTPQREAQVGASGAPRDQWVEEQPGGDSSGVEDQEWVVWNLHRCPFTLPAPRERKVKPGAPC